MKQVSILDANPETISLYGVCGYKNSKTPGFNEKIGWLKERYKEGLKTKIIYSEEHGSQGMIEYLPGEHCWRPVEATGYMFIHCLFVGFKKEYKGRGFATQLVEACEKDARDQKKYGVAVVTRKGPFMVDNMLFIKRGYEVADRAGSDFELLVKKFNDKAPMPKFRNNQHLLSDKYADGLILIRADQCPYTVKNINEIREAAAKEFGLKPRIITWQSAAEAQGSPVIFGTFGLLYNGRVIAEHPISKTRFVNIMKTLIG
ncbi:MAG: GNAT family N-acetyltransferase [Bacteroidales bacterium]|nr:GNAT family N-acetyltransferase [Bacteroidales bacterium]MBN2764530.1 GNAT family N-acetyltransferase [Bacteroidales bacterium]